MNQPPPTPPPILDIEKYRTHITEFELTEDQQVELLESLWFIMKSMVEFGFEVHSIQSFLPDFPEISIENGSELVKSRQAQSLKDKSQPAFGTVEKEETA
jgi:hypothetical protein